MAPERESLHVERRRVLSNVSIFRDLDDPALDLLMQITSTRSVRRRIDFGRAVEPDVIERCIEVATQAPTGRGVEGWRFLVMTDPDVKAEMAALYRRAFESYTALRGQAGDVTPPKPTYTALVDRLHEMPALILVCMEGQPLGDDNALRVAFYGSVLPAAWSLMVALRARGLGATWTSLHLLQERETAAALGIPAGVTQTVLLPVGYMQKAVLRPAARRAPREITYWNRWGATRDSL